MESCIRARVEMTRLQRDGLVSGNPIRGVALEDLTGQRRKPRKRGGKALTRRQYNTVLDYLLSLDPAEGIDKRGRRRKPSSVASRRNAIDQALLQAATGLRAREANGVRWPDVHVDDGQMSIDVTEEVAKGSNARVVLVLDQRVAERLLKRRDRADGKGYVLGSPSDPVKRWDVSNYLQGRTGTVPGAGRHDRHQHHGNREESPVADHPARPLHRARARGRAQLPVRALGEGGPEALHGPDRSVKPGQRSQAPGDGIGPGRVRTKVRTPCVPSGSCENPSAPGAHTKQVQLPAEIEFPTESGE